MANPPKSRAQHDLQGTRDQRELRTPPNVDGVPTKPKGLDKVASEHWDSIVPELVRLRVACSIDAPALEQLCRAWSLYHRAVEGVESIPASDFGTADTKRCVGMMSATMSSYNALCRQFGMTALSRNGIDVKPQTDTALSKFGR